MVGFPEFSSCFAASDVDVPHFLGYNVKNSTFFCGSRFPLFSRKGKAVADAVKLVNLAVYVTSFVCFLLSFRDGAPVAAVWGGIPFWLLLCAGIHESGHCLGCLLKRSPIREVRLPLFSIGDGTITLSRELWPVSYTRFRRSGRDWPVYLMGPVFSLLLWAALLLLHLHSRHPSILAGSILSFLALAVNAIPAGNNDMAMILREISHRNENVT